MDFNTKYYNHYLRVFIKLIYLKNRLRLLRPLYYYYINNIQGTERVKLNGIFTVYIPII